MLVAPSVCDVELFCTSQITYIFRTKHHKISDAWLRIFFTLFKFICSYVIKPATPNGANFATSKFTI